MSGVVRTSHREKDALLRIANLSLKLVLLHQIRRVTERLVITDALFCCIVERLEGQDPFLILFKFALTVSINTMLSGPMLAAGDPGGELKGAVDTLENLVFCFLEMFAAVYVIEFDVQGPALSG